MAEKKEKLVGKIAHYFPNISVGIVELTDDSVSVGDEIHVKGSTTDFVQKVESLQVEHKPVDTAKQGETVGLKVDEKIRDGDLVYKL